MTQDRASGESTLDVAIVGGGVSGLALAHRLARSGESRKLEVRLFERSDRFGGVVETERHDSWLFEGGPDSMVTAKPAGLELCTEVGLEEQVLSPNGTKTFSLVRAGRLHPLPEGFRMIAPTLVRPLLRSGLFSVAGKLRLLAEPYVKAVGQKVADDGGDESVRDFVVRRFGREAYERVAEPVLGGLFVADATKLSARRTLGPFTSLERRFGSVSRGLSSLASPEGPSQKTLRHGMGSLIDKLVDGIPEPWLLPGTEVVGLTRVSELPFTISTDRGPFRARNLVLACPAPRARALLAAPLPALAGDLAELCFVSCATVNLVYQRDDLGELPADFGFFAPAAENLGALAATYSSLKFEGRTPADQILIRTFHGGALDGPAVELDDPSLVDRAHRCLASVLRIDAAPIHARVFRVRDSMPQFSVGHLARVAAVRARVAEVRSLFLVGSALGHYGIPDCVTSCNEVADELLRELDNP